jgi:hypothetical protein
LSSLGSFNAKQVVGAIFAITLGVIFAVNLLAPQITGIFDTNTTGWDAGTAALWVVIGIVVVASLLYLFLKPSGIV